MKMILKDARRYDPAFGLFVKGDFLLDGGVLTGFSGNGSGASAVFQNCMILPGFADVHVHLREPGFSYKEDIASGTRAAARGGFTAVCAMPNLDPVPDSVPHIAEQIKLIRKKSVIAVYPYAALTVREEGEALSDMKALLPCAVAFSDDGRGVQSGDMMESAMRLAHAGGKVIAAHCEDDALRNGGIVNDGAYAKAHGLPGISAESEWRPIARDIALAEKTGCAYHVCHISTAKSVSLIREAKRRGVNVTCETAPHYLLLDDSMLQDDGAYKMNPPLRSPADREALLEGIADSTVDMIATDHAPHAPAEKSGGLGGSLMGIVGLETAFPLLYTGLVKSGYLTMERLMELLCYAPRRRFGLPRDDGFSVWSEDEYTIDPAEFLSKGRATPFKGKTVCGRCLLTVYKNKIVYMRG